MEIHKIILTRGIQGSGKSTWAKQWVAESPETRVRFNNDDMRRSCSVYMTFTNKREKLITEMKKNFMASAMNIGFDIVADNMNLNDKEVAFYEKIIKEFNTTHTDVQYEMEFKDFFIPLEECIERDKLRGSEAIGEKAIKQIWRIYRDKIIHLETMRTVENQVKTDETLPNCIIVDMDATVCFNTSGRPFYGDGSAELMHTDVPNPGVIKIIKNYAKTKNKNDAIIFVTGRDDSAREATTKYIKDHILPNTEFYLYTRKFGDYRKGDVCKQDIYEKNIKGKYNVDFVLDDSNKIVKMYRNLGLTVLQPNDGKF